VSLFRRPEDPRLEKTRSPALPKSIYNLNELCAATPADVSGLNLSELTVQLLNQLLEYSKCLRSWGFAVGIRRLSYVLGVLVVLVCATQAQQKGQYIPGQQGLNAGIMPTPGITYMNMTLNYSADKLTNANGNSVPLTGSYDIWANENIFYYVPKFKVLGGKFGMMAAPTFGNGSLSLGSLEFPNVAINAGGAGLADTWVQPVTLGWSAQRIESYFAYAFIAPTGRYEPGATDNVGSGYWGNNVLNGTTIYLTKNKGTTANLFTNWETHGSKTTAQGTKLTPGQAVTIEWGLGQALPLKKNMSQLLQIGVIGYDQWQVSDNEGLVAPLIPARLLPHYSVHAIGFQTSYILPTRGINFFFKWEDEYKAVARPQGRTIVFGGAITFPKPEPPAAP
jgi:hypothetical protein